MLPGCLAVVTPLYREGAEAQRAKVTHKVTQLRRGCLTRSPRYLPHPRPLQPALAAPHPVSVHRGIGVQNETLLCGNEVSDLRGHLTTLNIRLLLCHRRTVGPSQLARWLD